MVAGINDAAFEEVVDFREDEISFLADDDCIEFLSDAVSGDVFQHPEFVRFAFEGFVLAGRAVNIVENGEQLLLFVRKRLVGEMRGKLTEDDEIGVAAQGGTDLHVQIQSKAEMRRRIG